MNEYLNEDQFLADPKLALRLAEFLKANTKIEDVNNELLDKLNSYQSKYDYLKSQREEIESGIDKNTGIDKDYARANLKMLKQRQSHNSKLMAVAKSQLRHIKLQLEKLVEGT